MMGSKKNQCQAFMSHWLFDNIVCAVTSISAQLLPRPAVPRAALMMCSTEITWPRACCRWGLEIGLGKCHWSCHLKRKSCDCDNLWLRLLEWKRGLSNYLFCGCFLMSEGALPNPKFWNVSFINCFMASSLWFREYNVQILWGLQPLCPLLSPIHSMPIPKCAFSAFCLFLAHFAFRSKVNIHPSIGPKKLVWMDL